MAEPPGGPPLPYRARPPQVLLGVGAVLVVSGAAAVASGYGGNAAGIPLAVLAAIAAALSIRAARRELRSTEEILAACAVGLALVAGAEGGSLRSGSVVPLAAVAAACLLLHLVSPGTAAWPIGAWTAVQLAVLRLVDVVPPALHSTLFLAVALVGLGTALGGRRLVARIALVTSVPWWTAGVITGTVTAWTASGPARPLAALLMVAAAFGLLPARLRAELDVLLGPPVAVPALAGVVAGLGLSGGMAAAGTPGVTAAGYVGVLAATTVPEFLSGWRRLFRPVALAGGSTMALAAIVQLSAGAHWGSLSLLLLLTAVPSVLVAVLRPGKRPVAVPTALGCLAGSALFAVPAGALDAATAAVLLTALYAAALLAGTRLAEDVRRLTLVAAGVTAAVAVALVAARRELDPLAELLAVQGALTLAWGAWTVRPGAGQPPSAAWKVGAIELTLAAEVAAYDTGSRVLEAYSLPLAVGLLLGAGPRLLRGASWPAWGPGLLVAAVPSGVLAVVAPGSTRPVAVVVTAAVVLVGAGALGVRAPLMIAAATTLGVGLGLAVVASSWSLAGALAVGAVLLAVGARREEFPVAGFASRLADLR